MVSTFDKIKQLISIALVLIKFYRYYCSGTLTVGWMLELSCKSKASSSKSQHRTHQTSTKYSISLSFDVIELSMVILLHDDAGEQRKKKHNTSTENNIEDYIWKEEPKRERERKWTKGRGRNSLRNINKWKMIIKNRMIWHGSVRFVLVPV